MAEASSKIVHLIVRMKKEEEERTGLRGRGSIVFRKLPQ
jgi:hypothetical protein